MSFEHKNNHFYASKNKFSHNSLSPVGLKNAPQGKMILGDCIEQMRLLPDESVKAIVTSPPYNIKNSSGNGLKDGRGGKWPKAELIGGYDQHNDHMPHADYVDWQRNCLSEMMRVLRPDGAIFYNHKWRVQNGLIQDRSDIVEGFPVRQIIIWKRAGGINFNPGYFLPNYEVIYLICKKDFKLAPKANALGCIWEIPQETKNPHPAPFPVELAHKCISSIGEGTILDPFLGSGSTAIAAEMLGHDWIGIDNSEEYLNLAAERLANFRDIAHDPASK